MSRDEVAAIAKAIALANGHSHPDDYAEAVANAYVEPEETEGDQGSSEEEG